MASNMLKSTSLLKTCVSKWSSTIPTQSVPAVLATSNFSTSSSSNAKDVRQIRQETALMRPEEAEHRRKLQGYITVDGPSDISPITGIPEEHIKTRTVRIYEPPKNCMQSGTDNIGFWEMDFDTRTRWENPLMGWCSSGDPMSNMKIQFRSKEEAIAHCEKNGWQYYIQNKKEKGD